MLTNFLIFPSLLMKIFSWKFYHMTLHLPKTLIFAFATFLFQDMNISGRLSVYIENGVFYLIITVNTSQGQRNTMRSILKVNKKPYSFYYNWKIIHMMVFIIWVPFQVRLKWIILFMWLTFNSRGKKT